MYKAISTLPVIALVSIFILYHADITFMYNDRVSALTNIPDSIFRIRARYVFINYTVQSYRTRFQIFRKAAPQMVAFPVLTSRNEFSDVSEKLGVFKFQDH